MGEGVTGRWKRSQISFRDISMAFKSDILGGQKLLGWHSVHVVGKLDWWACMIERL
jgi:hypothetical protein